MPHRISEFVNQHPDLSGFAATCVAWAASIAGMVYEPMHPLQIVSTIGTIALTLTMIFVLLPKGIERWNRWKKGTRQ